MKTILKIQLIIGLFLIFVPVTNAHPGRTDAYGCHTCRTNCSSWGLSTGEYHCHNAKQPTQPEEPITSHYSSTGSGYTTPAPEYKYETPTAPTEINNTETITKSEEQITTTENEKITGPDNSTDTKTLSQSEEQTNNDNSDSLHMITPTTTENKNLAVSTNNTTSKPSSDTGNYLIVLFIGGLGIWIYRKFKKK